MSAVRRLIAFNGKVESSIKFSPSSSELKTACTDLINCFNDLDNAERLRSLKSLGYFCLDYEILPEVRDRCQYCFSEVMHKDLLAIVIQDLRQMLLQVKNSQLSEQGRLKVQNKLVLNPKKGLAFAEDKIRSDWAENGGERAVSLFYAVLGELRPKDVSSNLGWIVPGILNLMDDTSDLEGIKLQGVVLLNHFLKKSLDIQSEQRFDFASTGLTTVFEPILTSMWYHFPQSTEPGLTKKIWGTVFPALMSLYRAEYFSRPELLRESVSRFLGETLLQVTVPRISADYMDLTIDTVNRVGSCLDVLGEKSVIHMQRILYVFGEYLICNVFITDFRPLLPSVLAVLTGLVEKCARDRVIAHKYNLLTCALVMCERCYAEENSQDPKVHQKCLPLIRILKDKGGEWTEDESRLVTSRLMSMDLEL
ncbi:LAME_0G17876g1_1 [Lachancea meyersii CBS 8951]|uniref:LAME_0G17876g1_1 n=1 Tax=Lachancea meyersii CBS 8951 TaxID=1266667 RepID=A0A1G4KBK5_9SACH|nr:LAME_0G17876g1_1 [Lachancea meyersii CBS 8951]